MACLVLGGEGGDVRVAAEDGGVSFASERVCVTYFVRVPKRVFCSIFFFFLCFLSYRRRKEEVCDIRPGSQSLQIVFAFQAQRIRCLSTVLPSTA